MLLNKQSISLLPILFLGLLTTTSSQAWQLEKVDDETSIQVWTQSVKDSSFKAFRGQVLIQAPLSKVLDVVGDTPNIPKWYHNTSEARKLTVIHKNQSLNYSIATAPWPVSNRDSVTLVTKKQLSDNSYLITLQAQPNQYPEQPGLVRIPKLEGYWHLTPIAEDLTNVVFEVAAEPGGEVPSWLANSMVIDMPFYTLSNLKERVESVLD